MPTDTDRPAPFPSATPRQIELFRALGAVIGEGRRNAGLSQAALAAELGVPTATVSTWEIGRRLPDLAHRRTLAERLAIPPAALLVEEACARCGKPWR